MPYRSNPPGLAFFSNSVTSCPARANCCAPSHPGGTRSDDGDAFAGLGRRGVRDYPPFLPGAIGDRALDGLDRYRSVIDVERARFLARRRADTTGEFGEVVGRVQHLHGFAPLVAVNEVVPVGNDVVDRAAGVADTGYRNPCIARPAASVCSCPAGRGTRGNAGCDRRPVRNALRACRFRENR